MYKQFLKTIFYRPHLRRTGAIALIVGAWLTWVNQSEVILAGQLDWGLVGKIFLNFLTPFVVANLGLWSRDRDQANLQD